VKEVLKNIILENQQFQFPEIKERNLEIPNNIGIIVSLIGTRRSGKTYLLYKKIVDLIKNGIDRNKIVLINFEDERIELNGNNLDLIIQSYRELFPEINLSDVYFFFDEIQNTNSWEKFIRRIFDTLSRNIFITGSNSKLLSTEIATELRGRTLTIKVFPLSLSEYLRFNGVSTDFSLQKNRSKIIQQTEKFLTQGGFPETLFLAEKYQIKLLQDYLNIMIFRDIVERYKVSNIDVLKFFIKKLFASVTKPFSINKTYNDLKSQGYKISNNYLYDFFDYCNDIFLCQTIRKFDYSEIKQAKSDTKSYIIDTGLLSAIEFSVSKNKGKLLENMVFLELLKSEKEIFYYKNKYECDFIVKESNIVPIQVCYSLNNQETRDREIRGLLEAANYLNVKNGIIITFDEEEIFKMTDVEIEVVPVYKYFLR
jgi:uncharacterized protein